MQRQKTVAKWLAIILLLTLAVGAYIIYDAVSAAAPTGNAAADDNGDGDGPVVTPDPPEHIPYYSTLPRPAETIGGKTVAHAGGEGEDVLRAAFPVGSKLIVFFESGSEEFDLKGGGTAIAVFDGGTLISCAAFTQLPFAACKFFGGGIAALAGNPEEAGLFLFDLDGALVAEREFDGFDDAEFYLDGNKLQLFYTSDGKLNAASVGDGLQVQKSAFVLPVENAEIMQLAAFGGELTVIAEERGKDTSVISFSQYKGFKRRLIFDQLQFVQLAFVNASDGARMAILGKHRETFAISTLTPDYTIEKSAAAEGSLNAALFGSGATLTLVADGVTITYCAHLDKLSSIGNGLDLGRVAAAKQYGGDFYILSCGDAVGGEYDFALIRTDSSGNYESLFDGYADENGRIGFYLSSGTPTLTFSTSRRAGVFRMGFGLSDVFCLTLSSEAD